jgi:hypothetical protein
VLFCTLLHFIFCSLASARRALTAPEVSSTHNSQQNRFELRFSTAHITRSRRCGWPAQSWTCSSLKLANVFPYEEFLVLNVEVPRAAPSYAH